jgi:hypothetical protein
VIFSFQIGSIERASLVGCLGQKYSKWRRVGFIRQCENNCGCYLPVPIAGLQCPDAGKQGLFVWETRSEEMMMSLVDWT